MASDKLIVKLSNYRYISPGKTTHKVSDIPQNLRNTMSYKSNNLNVYIIFLWKNNFERLI